FQAEDGIRYPLVTGVQTCALPIFLFDCLVDRGCGFHTLSGGKTFTRDQSGKRRPCGDLFHRAIPAASPVCHVVRQEKIYGSRNCSGCVSHGGRRNGCREETVFSKL